MKLGITAARCGTVVAQLDTLECTIRNYREVMNEFHHGCCIGGDEEGVVAAYNEKYHIVGYPPLIRKYVSTIAESLSHVLLDPEEYLQRNKNIVDAVDLLIVAPDSFEPRARSGTWSTYRYAQRTEVPRLIIWPDGTVRAEGGLKISTN